MTLSMRGTSGSPEPEVERLTREIEYEGTKVKATLPEPSIVLEDGTRAWFQRRRLDCMRAAVATLSQIPYDQLPELFTMKQVKEWAEEQGYQLQLHMAEEPPVHLERWIGVSPRDPETGDRHTVVMEHGRLLFDPASGWDLEGGFQVAAFTHCEYGFSIDEGTPPC